MIGEAETFSQLAGLVSGMLLLLIGFRGLRRQTPEVVGCYSWTDLSFGLLLIFGITIPMAISWCDMVLRWFRPFTMLPSGSSIGAILGLLFGLAIVSGLGILIRSIIRGGLFSQWSTRRFLVIALGVGTGIKFAYVLLVEMTPVNDFNAMWQLSGAIVERGWPYTEEIYQSFHLFGHSGVYGHLSLSILILLQRCLTYFVPLVYLLGKSPLVYKLANVVVLSLCALITFSLARRWFGEQASRGVLLLTLIVPETFFSAAISTHDIPGTLYLMLSLWLLDTMAARANQRFLGNLGLSMALGCALTLMEIQRSTGFFWFLALSIYVVAHSISPIRQTFVHKSRNVSRVLRNNLRWVILILIIPWGIYQGLYQVLDHKGWVLSSDQNKLVRSIWLAAYSDMWDYGTLGPCYIIYNRIYQDSNSNAVMSSEDWQDFARDKLLSDLYYNPMERFGNYIRKSHILYALGSQYFYYNIFPRIKPSSPISGEWAEKGLRAQNLNFLILFCPVFIWLSLLLLWYRQIPDQLWPAVLVLSIQSLVLLLLGACQPRYVYPIWFIGPLVIGAQFGNWREVSKDFEKTGTKVRRLLPMMAVMLSMILLGLVGLRWMAHVSDRRMLDFSQWTEVEANYPLPDCDYLDSLQSKIVAKRHFQLALAHGRLPKSGDVISVSKTYGFEDHYSRMFKVFVHSPYQSRRSTFSVQAFTVMILINDKLVSQFPIADLHTARQIVVEDIVPENGSVRIAFAIKANVDIPGVSWQRAPLVYFEFAQLRRGEESR